MKMIKEAEKWLIKYSPIPRSLISPVQPLSLSPFPYELTAMALTNLSGGAALYEIVKRFYVDFHGQFY